MPGSKNRPNQITRGLCAYQDTSEVFSHKYRFNLINK